MLSTTLRLKPLLKKLALFSMLTLFYACDVVDHDAAPNGPTVDVVGTEVVILSNGSAYIDLYSKIKTTSSVRLDISSQPRKGDLSEVGTGFLKYSPDQHFTRGRDAFAFSIYDENNHLLKSDSLVIIVEDDSTNLPCGIYPQDDFVYQATGGPVQVNVLANDILCGDSANLILEVYRPNNNFPPYAGTATVLSNSVIQYTPGSNFSGSDEFIYKISSASDSSLVGFAVVHISAETQCNFVVNDDTYTINPDSIHYDSLGVGPAHYDTLQLYVLNNDMLCDSAGVGHSFSIIQAPQHGTAYYSNQAPIGYVYQHSGTSTAYTDSLVYRVCVDQRCKFGIVKINVQ